MLPEPVYHSASSTGCPDLGALNLRLSGSLIDIKRFYLRLVVSPSFWVFPLSFWGALATKNLIPSNKRRRVSREGAQALSLY
jgi:hypothetical protein